MIKYVMLALLTLASFAAPVKAQTNSITGMNIFNVQTTDKCPGTLHTVTWTVPQAMNVVAVNGHTGFDYGAVQDVVMTISRLSPGYGNAMIADFGQDDYTNGTGDNRWKVMNYGGNNALWLNAGDQIQMQYSCHTFQGSTSGGLFILNVWFSFD